MIHLITYSDDKMLRSRKLCATSAVKQGCDSARGYGPEDISEEFRQANSDILSAERGCGYWLWKPYIIYKEMLSLSGGDILIYSDAGQEFVGSVHPMIQAMQGDIMLFSNGWKHIEWCKGSVCKAILGDHWSHYDNRQAQASLQVYRVSQKSLAFVKEWLMYCQIPGLIDDSPCDYNYPTFADHRHDQAILGCLAIKYGITLRWFPTTTNMHQQQPGDSYPAVILHHRRRDTGKGGGEVEW